mgnify:CR=1 FL=1
MVIGKAPDGNQAGTPDGRNVVVEAAIHAIFELQQDRPGGFVHGRWIARVENPAMGHVDFEVGLAAGKATLGRDPPMRRVTQARLAGFARIQFAASAGV